VMGIAPGKEGTIDKLRAVIAVDAQKKGKGRSFRMSGRASNPPFWALLRRGLSPAHPEKTSVASRVRPDKSPQTPPHPVLRSGGGLPSVRVNLEKAEQTCLPFSLVPGVIGPDRDVLFQEFARFHAAYAREGRLLPVLFQGPVNGSGTYKSLALMSVVIRKGGLGSKKGICSRIRGAGSFPQRQPEKARIILGAAGPLSTS
jgi:hypothetical protein